MCAGKQFSFFTRTFFFYIRPFRFLLIFDSSQLLLKAKKFLFFEVTVKLSEVYDETVVKHYIFCSS